MIDITLIERLDEKAQLALFVFTFVSREHSVSQLRETMALAEVVLPKVQNANALCQQLCGERILGCERGYHYGSDYYYKLADKFAPAALTRLLEISVERNWWRIFGYDDTVPHAQSRSVGDFGTALRGYGWRCVDRAFQLRQLVSGRPMGIVFDGYHDEESAQWQVAELLPSLVELEANGPLCPQWGRDTPLAGYFRLLATLLTQGRSSAWLTGQMADAAKDGRIALTGPQCCELVSHCILNGHADRAAGVRSGDADGKSDAFAELSAALRKGDLAAANDICSLVDKTSELGRLECPASNLLALLVSVFARPSLTRAAKYIRALSPNASRGAYDRSEGEQNAIVERNRVFHALQGIVTGVRPTLDLKQCHLAFVGTLSEPVRALLVGMNRKESARIAGAMLATAERAVAKGYPTIAGVYMTVFGWALGEGEKARAEAAVARIGESGGVWFRPFLGVDSSWQRIVAVLDERLPKAVAKKSADAGKVKSGRIVWGIDESDVRLDLQPFFRRPRGADDGTDDRKVTLKSVCGGKYDDCLTEADKTVVAVLRKSKYVGPKGGAEIPSEVFAAFCGQDNVVRIAPGEKAKEYVETPIRFVRREIPLVAKSEEGGGLTLNVPEWALQRYAHHMILRPEPDLYEFYAIGKDKAPLLDVFREYGEKGTIRLPKEAMAKARPLLGRMAALIPLQGDLANAAGESGLRRITGDAMPLVRLSVENDALALALRVRPAADAKNAVYEPGAGQSERTIALAGGAAVLVRDLAEEKRRAQDVEAALVDCETWREGRLDWAIDDPAAALSALSAVRALGEKAHVEWQPGKKIGLAKPRKMLALGAMVGADRWFSVSGDCELDDGRVVTLVKLLSRLGERVGRFVPIDENGYVELSRPLLRALEALETAGRASKGKFLVSPAALPMLDAAFAEGGEAIAMPKAMRVEAERIRDALAGRHVAPERLKAVLRPYQEEGFEWLARLAACGLGGCLADDMGLGKTVQLIALLLERAADGASLVVAPTSVAGNWRGEIRRFAPTLNAIVAGEGSDGAWLGAGAHDVVIVSYGLLVSRAAKFLSREWNGVILDEAQSVKNAETERAKTVKKLVAKFRVAATGTPVENRLTDLWSVFDFLNPGLLGTANDFERKFAEGGRATSALKSLVRPLVLRRLKRDVLDDLPEKTEVTLAVPLEGDERAGYEACRVTALETLEKGGKENRISILAELMRLRRYCCHPSLVLPEVASGAKLEALMELLRDLKGANHRALVFSQFTDFLAIVERRIGQEGFSYQYLDGATSPQERERRVAAFQRGEGDLFLMSLKAGGTGINLTAANYVVLLDPWWNPAVEDQAADRAHRIGQRNPVTVYRLIAADTVEERVLELHREKKELARDVLDGTGSASLTPEALMKLFG